MATALMTTITTIAVSFIGIVPTLRRGDAEEITALKQQLNNMEKAHASANSPTAPEKSTDKKIAISGKVSRKDGKSQPLDVYFLPDDNSQLTIQTDDSGKFYKEIPSGTYSIIVREGGNGTSGKLRLDEDEVGRDVKLDKFNGATVNYRINYR
ncbi:MAG: hypothetical protein JO360_04780 [Acidobacteria bacterium]|nr:hypothetical protein [Acidobacteriota bacterium]